MFSATLLGGAIEAQAWSSYADFLFNSAISNFTKTHLGTWTVGPPLARSVSELFLKQRPIVVFKVFYCLLY